MTLRKNRQHRRKNIVSSLIHTKDALAKHKMASFRSHLCHFAAYVSDDEYILLSKLYAGNNSSLYRRTISRVSYRMAIALLHREIRLSEIEQLEVRKWLTEGELSQPTSKRPHLFSKAVSQEKYELLATHLKKERNFHSGLKERIQKTVLKQVDVSTVPVRPMVRSGLNLRENVGEMTRGKVIDKHEKTKQSGGKLNSIKSRNFLVKTTPVSETRAKDSNPIQDIDPVIRAGAAHLLDWYFNGEKKNVTDEETHLFFERMNRPNARLKELEDNARRELAQLKLS